MRKTTCFVALAVFYLFVLASADAALVWSGAVGDVFDDTQWGGVVDPSTDVNDDLIVNSGAASNSSTTGNLDLGEGIGSLSVTGGLLDMLDGANNGIRATAGAGGGTTPLSISGGEVRTQFMTDQVVTLSGTGVLTLNGGGNPVNLSTIDFTSLTSQVNFLAETPTQAQTEHLAKMTVSGNIPVPGVNISIVSDGGSGSIVTATSLAPIVPVTMNYTGLGGDPTDFTDLGNWDTTPTGGIIDPNLLLDDYVINDARANLQDTVALALEGGSLTVQDGNLTLTGGAAGLGKLGGPSGSVDISGGTVATQFIADVALTLDVDAVLTLNGGGNPINLSTIDFASTGTTLNMLGEDVTAFLDEHLAKITVFGQPAVEGVNLLVVSDGGSGSIVTAIPEPSSLILCGLAILGLAASRLRR